MPQKAPTSTTGTGDTAGAEGDRASGGVQHIPTMKAGWFYDPVKRTILHSPSKGGPMARVGTAPKVTGVVRHLTDDGLVIRIEYQVLAPRQRRKRIISEDELDRGTWAAKLGVPRPTGPDARQAFAKVVRLQADGADEIPARSYYNEAGDLIAPDADAQSFGYMTCAGTEEHARDVWNEIGAAAANDPHAALVMGAFFSGPILDYLQVPAHILNVYGGGQMGKSTIQTTCAGTMGNIKPRQQKLMMPWSSSKQGLTQGLRMRGYMPVAFEEHSSSGRTPKQAGPELSQMVAGATRETATADGSPRESDGFWWSLILSSSNKPLRWQGQTEDLASRLLEIPVPFYANCWMDADGNYAAPGTKGAEHLSKRLKRLAKSAGGWPLVWANQMGMFKAPNLAVLRKRHLELCAKYSPHTGGIPDTIAEIYMAWVVGAEMLGKAIGDDVEEALPDMAEQTAAQLLQPAIEEASDVNIPDGERLWYGLDALRIEAFAYPPIEDVAKATTDGFHKVKGFVSGDHWFVTRDVVQDVAAREGLDNVGDALHQLEELGVHIREKSAGNRSAAKQLPKQLRGQGTGLPTWLHCFDTRRADELWAPEEASEDAGNQLPNAREPRGTTPGTTAVVPENSPLTSAGTTGTTGTTISENAYPKGKRERLELIEIMDPLETVPAAGGTAVVPLQRKPSEAETAVPGTEVPSHPDTRSPAGTNDSPGSVPGYRGTGATVTRLFPRRPGTDPVAGVDPAEEVDSYRYNRGSQDAVVSAPARPVYPAAAHAVTDQAFARIELEAEGWTRSGIAFGVLSADAETGPALLLPNRAPVRLALPESVNQVPALMDAYGLRTLWIHSSAALAMGLPTLEQRRTSPRINQGQEDEEDQEDQNLGLAGKGMWSIGPQTPTAHAWADLDAAGPLKALTPGGLASWLTLVRPGRDGGKDDRLSVALPMYDSRIRKDRKISGWGGATSAAELLDALMVWTVASSFTYRNPKGKQRTEVIPYYVSVNRTAQDFAGRGRTPEELERLTRCETVRRQEIPCLIRNTTPLMVPQQWGRPLTDAEAAGAVALHRFDKTAAWLGAFSSVELGVGEPVHAVDGAEYNKKQPGFWRVAEIPGTGPEGLPPLVLRPDQENGGYWISTPSMDLLIEIYPTWTPQIVEAWYWEEFSRGAMGHMYRRVKRTRLGIVAEVEAGRPGARWAKQIIGRTYQSFRGYMARVDGPMTDRATGGDYRKDLYYRPDWARLIMDLATANMYRNLMHFADEGVSALAVCVDAITFASTEADPEAARPPYMTEGKARWTHEGSAPIAELLDTLQAPEPGEFAHAHHVLNTYLNTPGE